jgi:hypothetical protein
MAAAKRLRPLFSTPRCFRSDSQLEAANFRDDKRINLCMKKNFQFSTMILGAALLCGPAFSLGQQTDSGAKQDMKNAGRETKYAVKDAAHGTKQGTKKAYHKTKRGTKKAYRKTKDTTKGAVNGAKEGAKTPE